MSGLQRFEQRLEQAISGVFARTFRSAVQPVEIAAALQRELDNQVQIVSRTKRLVPNVFHVELATSDHDRLAAFEETLATELSDQLEEHAELQSYTFPGPIRIHLEVDDDLTTGRFRVRSVAEARVTGRGRASSGTASRAFVEVNGTRHPLTPPGMVVGRGSDTDLRIDDPGVSRRHAEFLVTSSARGALRVEVHDMGSTNGIRVDGQKVARADLHNGSRVRVGSTSLEVRIEEQPDV